MTNMYAQDGVNVAEGDLFSVFAGEVCRGTFSNSPFIDVHDFSNGHFRGPRAWRPSKNVPEGCWFDVAPDGIGTKVVVIDAAFAHKFAASNGLAMTGGDITRWGGTPVLCVNVLDVATLDTYSSYANAAYRQMLLGLREVAHECNIVCFRGETAELGVCVASENPDAMTKFNWAFAMIGLYREDRVVTGDSIGPGHAVIALCEPTFRSNGFSSARAALRTRFGDEWWRHPDAQDIIRDLARPSTMYDKFLSHANGWTVPVRRPNFRFHAIIHVTGGGIVGKFGEDILAPRGLSAELNDLWQPSETMRQIVEWRGTPDEECYRTFVCGNGVLVVLNQLEVPNFIQTARRYGIQARQCGRITKQVHRSTLAITSGFTGNILEYTFGQE